MCQTPQQELRIIELLILYIAKILLLVPSVSWPGLKQHSSRLRCEQIFKLQPQLQERTCSFRISLHIHSISRTSARTDLVCFCVPLYCIVLYCNVLYAKGSKIPPKSNPATLWSSIHPFFRKTRATLLSPTERNIHSTTRRKVKNLRFVPLFGNSSILKCHHSPAPSAPANHAFMPSVLFRFVRARQCCVTFSVRPGSKAQGEIDRRE